MKGGPFGKKIPEKSLTMPKNPLVSLGMVCNAGKQEKPFWFSSLGQMVQFGAIIFCRTFVELFWSFQVVLKTPTKSHDYSRLFSKEKRRLKNCKTKNENVLPRRLRIQVAHYQRLIPI